MMRHIVTLAVIFAAGCATTQGGWEKAGSTERDFYRDRGQCVSQMASVSLAGPQQQAVVFAGCMQGKDWYWVERPIQH